jgi:hypothetical protein
MTCNINDFLQVPSASVAAPKGCIRITVINRKRQGISAVFRLEDVEQYMLMVKDSIVPCLDTPVHLTMQIASVINAGRVADEDAPLVALMALWVARENEGKPLREAIDTIARATGRVALQLREVKPREWTFLVGIEKGTREGTPIAQYPQRAGFGSPLLH